MLPAALSLALLLALVAPASAQLVRGVDVVEQGIYTADIDRTVRGTDGLFRNVLSNICHVLDTDTIPARLGLHFGFRYRLNGTEGRAIDVRKITVFPRAMMPPGAVRPIAQTEHVFQRTIGSVSFTGYAFDEPPELVPGVWQFQMWHGARMLSEMKFSVIEDNGMRLPRTSNANCFRVSSL